MKDLKIYKTTEDFNIQYPDGNVPCNDLAYIEETGKAVFSTNNIDGTTQQITVGSSAEMKEPIFYNPNKLNLSTNLTAYFTDGTVLVIISETYNAETITNACTTNGLSKDDITTLIINCSFGTNSITFAKLKKVIYTDSVSASNDSSFIDNTSIEYVRFGVNQDCIGCNTFRNCTNLNTIVFDNPDFTIVDDETSEYDWHSNNATFYQDEPNSKLVIYSKITTPWDLDEFTTWNIYDGTLDVELHIPTGYKAKYQSNWGNYFTSCTIIEDYNE